MTLRPKLLLIAFILFVTACGSGGDVVQEEYTIDEATGLPLNPQTIPDGDFVIEGTIANMNLTPQSEPELVLKVSSGQTYRVRTQPLSDIFYDDGGTIGIPDFAQGMQVRATISQIVGGPETGNSRQFVTEDLVIIK